MYIEKIAAVAEALTFLASIANRYPIRGFEHIAQETYADLARIGQELKGKLDDEALLSLNKEVRHLPLIINAMSRSLASEVAKNIVFQFVERMLSLQAEIEFAPDLNRESRVQKLRIFKFFPDMLAASFSVPVPRKMTYKSTGYDLVFQFFDYKEFTWSLVHRDAPKICSVSNPGETYGLYFVVKGSGDEVRYLHHDGHWYTSAVDDSGSSGYYTSEASAQQAIQSQL